MKSWAFLLAMAAVAVAAPAGAAPVKTDHLQVELAPESRTVAPGSTFYVALHQKIQKGWHTYWRNPGDSGQATEITWTLPEGWKAGEPVWPAPHRFVTGPLMNYVYSDEVFLPVPISAPAGAKLGDAILKAEAHFLVCSDICVPEDAKLEIVLPVAKGAPQGDPVFGGKIAETLAAAPKPDGLKASFENKGGKLTVSITGAAVKGQTVGKAYFYPYDASLIDHAKPQLAEQGPDGLSFTLVPGFAFDDGKSPAEIKGVVSLSEGEGVELTAAPGPRLAGSFGTTPPVATTKADGAPVDAAASSLPGASMNVFAALGLAFLGGLILNLMPCVFPVLSIKAAALARHGEQPGEARAQGLVFMLGTVSTFLVLAGLLIAARAGGEAVGWGFQLQSPVVVAVLCLIMLGSGLNLSGVFEMGTSVQGAGQGLASRGGLLGAFFTGVLAVVVAAPCTAPFMAGAIGWALVQPPVVALSVFLALGVGLAAPFTALTFAPALFRKLPKPGAWMNTLRQVLAFPMYAAAAWLAWVFATQAGVNALPLLFAAALAAAIAAYAWGAAQHAQGGKVWLPRVVAAVFLIAAAPLIVYGGKTAPAAAEAAGGSQKASGALPTEPWSPERVAALQAEGRPVFVDFTAAWCVTCQVNERTTLAGARVAEAFAKTNAVYLKADWTNQDATIAKALAEQGRSGVPLYLVYGPTGAPKILPQLLTEGLVVDALEGAFKPA